MWPDPRNAVNARLRLPVVVTAVALLALACASDDDVLPAFSGDIAAGNPVTAEAEAPTISGEAPDPTPLDDEGETELQAALATSPTGCDTFDTRSCLLPFPSDEYTVEDTSSGTGRRVDLPTGLLPNADGATLDPTAWNRNDGFSPSTPILVHIPNFAPENTPLPTEDEIGVSVTEESATVIVDLDTGQLVPHWAEMDRRATSDEDRALILRPAISLPETHRFAVALRDIRGPLGGQLTPPVSFRVLRDNNTTSSEDPELEERREHMEPIFAEMAEAGVNRADLYLAWHFTVASEETLASNVLAMRDDAFGRLAGQAPRFRVAEESTDDLEPGIAKVVRGTFEVPNYLTGTGSPGSSLDIDPATNLPQAVGVLIADFTCTVPSTAVESGEAAPVVYGHGLLGSADEVASSQVQATAAANNSLYCGTDAIGMSSEDVSYAIEALSDISDFPPVPDRIQQGMLNTLFLGRLMVHLGGFGDAPEFQTIDGANMINTEEAYYDGNSQGAIIGGAVTAIAQDWTKAVLGVGGMNYSTLLNRSVDFDEYAVILRAAYPNALDQQLVFGLLQMLWDRGETSGYVQHLTDRTYELTPPKTVLMAVAFGDHQVAPITAQNIARTLGIPIYQPALPPGATIARQPFYGLDPIRSFPQIGSALYYWDSGALAPPLGNITPTMSERYIALCTGANEDNQDSAPCEDPHEDPRRQPEMIEQKQAFFQPAGVITNVCDGAPCIALPRSDFDY